MFHEEMSYAVYHVLNIIIVILIEFSMRGIISNISSCMNLLLY